MTTQEARETIEVRLPPDLSIGRAAREVVRHQAGPWGLPDEIAHRVMIVATELATNALLHATPPFALRLTSDRQRIRVAIHDSLALTPALRQYDVLALTGRGLQLVADCSATWGVQGGHAGKEVWAEVPFVDDGQAPQGMQTSGLTRDGSGREDDAVVCFLATPVATYLALQEWNDAVVRECELIAALQPAPTLLPPRLLELAVRLSGRFAAEREGFRDVMALARAQGSSVVDLEERWRIPNEPSVAAADAFLAMMEELDDFCGTDVLLSQPPDPAVVRLRRWFVTEMRAQLLEGAAPTPYRETDDRSGV